MISFLPKEVWYQILDVRRFVLNWETSSDEVLESPASESSFWLTIDELGVGVISGDLAVTESREPEWEEAIVQWNIGGQQRRARFDG